MSQATEHIWDVPEGASKLKRFAVKLMLGILNSRWMNNSPCKYGFIGNVDAFDYSHLVSEEKQRPGITVKNIINEADRFRSCPLSPTGLTVIDGDETREVTIWDLNDLRNMREAEGKDQAAPGEAK